MEFTSQEKVQESVNYLNNIPVPECPGCKKGILMCYNTPCMGTVDDIERLMNAGYAKNLMLDWWGGTGHFEGEPGSPIRAAKRKQNEFEEDVPYLVPATVGNGGKKTPLNKRGKCNLLVDDKCSVHHIKPILGRNACCKIDGDMEIIDGVEILKDERIDVLRTWNTQRGKDLIARWKEEVGYDEEQGEGLDVPTDLMGMMKAMLDFLTPPEIPDYLKDEISPRLIT